MRVVRKVCVKNGGDWDVFTRLGTMKVQVIRLVSARQFRLVIIFSSNSKTWHKLMPRRFQMPWRNPTACLRIECRRTIPIEHWPAVTARYLGSSVPTWRSLPEIATIALDCVVGSRRGALTFLIEGAADPTGYRMVKTRQNTARQLTSGVSSRALAEVAKPAAAKRRAETFMVGTILKKCEEEVPIIELL